MKLEAACVGAERKRRDIICHDPRSNTKYAIDVTTMSPSDSPGLSLLACATRVAAAKGKWKRSDAGWGECLREHQGFADSGVFVPFVLEISSSLEPEAATFYAMANEPRGGVQQQHDPSLYHWDASGNTGHRNSEPRWFGDGLALAKQRPNDTGRKCSPRRHTAAWLRTETLNLHPRSTY